MKRKVIGRTIKIQKKEPWMIGIIAAETNRANLLVVTRIARMTA